MKLMQVGDNVVGANVVLVAMLTAVDWLLCNYRFMQMLQPVNDLLVWAVRKYGRIII
ncbi:MAG: hypothetical protein WC449_05250 [Candidatus Paceibacterota bacterium]